MSATASSADLILHNGRFTTLDRTNPTASAVAINGGVFMQVGDDARVLKLAGAGTRIVNLKGKRGLPGLIDNHLHTTRGRLNFKMELRWDGLPSLAYAMSMLRRRVGGFAGWRDPEAGKRERALGQQAMASCGCANNCGVHGHAHATAWSSALPVVDLKSFWGALGCACWAV